MNNKKFRLSVPPTWRLPVLLAGLILLLKLFFFTSTRVENGYANGIYPYISRFLRFFTAWLPFSLGDLFYSAAIIYVLYKTFRFLQKLFRRQVTRAWFIYALRKLLVFALSFYLVFLFLWGLNYNRKGIAWQLQLKVQPYTTADLDTVLGIVLRRLENLADSQQQRPLLEKRAFLFAEAARQYKKENVPYPFLELRNPAVKRSVFGMLSNYMGFQGYYNPFTGEAQVNTTVPVYMRPNIVCHELAHMVGYAKENEANFVGYLTGRLSPNPCFRYSAYFDLMQYGFAEMRLRDSARSRMLAETLPPIVKADLQEWYRFRKKYKNPMENVVMWFYGQYLKANNMPAGVATYNEVIAWLVAFYKKNGAAAL